MTRLSKVLDRIREKVLEGECEFAIPHFFQEMVADDLDLIDIETAIADGHINRILTSDIRGTRYEVVGNAIDGRQIGVVCRFKKNGKVLLITVYEIE
jgi:hypothetical protein